MCCWRKAEQSDSGGRGPCDHCKDWPASRYHDYSHPQLGTSCGKPFLQNYSELLCSPAAGLCLKIRKKVSQLTSYFNRRIYKWGMVAQW